MASRSGRRMDGRRRLQRYPHFLGSSRSIRLVAGPRGATGRGLGAGTGVGCRGLELCFGPAGRANIDKRRRGEAGGWTGGGGFGGTPIFWVRLAIIGLLGR